MSPTLAKCHCWGNRGVGRAILIGAAGQTAAHKHRNNIIPMLFIAAEQAVFEQEWGVAGAILDRSRVVLNVRGYPENNLDVPFRNQFQTLATAVIFGQRSVRASLPGEIVTKLLLESRRHGDQRCNPVWLLSLSGRDPVEPIGEVILRRGFFDGKKTIKRNCAQVNRKTRKT